MKQTLFWRGEIGEREITEIENRERKRKKYSSCNGERKPGRRGTHQCHVEMDREVGGEREGEKERVRKTERERERNPRQ